MTTGKDPLMIDTSATRPPQQTTLRDLCGVLFRHKKRAVLTFVTLFVLAVAVTLLWPKTYESGAKLLVRVGRESVSLDPTASSSGQVLGVRQSHESEVNSELEILTSADVLGPVVDAFGPVTFAPPGVLQILGILGPGNVREKAIDNLKKDLDIEALANSSIITLSVNLQDPVLAQKVLAKLIEVYMASHITAHRTSGSFEFFTQETENLRHALAASESELRDVKNRTHIGSVDDQRRILLARLGTLQQEIEQTDAGLASSRAKVKSMKGMLSDMPETVVTEQTSGLPNAAADGMRQKLYDLQLKEQDLLSRYQETSEPVQEVRRQIAEAQTLLAQEDKHRTQVTQGMSTTHQRVKSDFLAESADLSALEARSGTLKREMQSARRELQTLNNSEVQIAQLERQVQNQKETLLKYSTNLEQARIDQALESEKISNISVVESATLETIPVSPRLLLNLVLGFLLATVASVALAFGSESIDHSIKNPRDVEERLQLPTLLALPYQRETATVMASSRGGRERRTARVGAGRVRDTEALETVRIDPRFESLRDRLAFTANGHMSVPCVIAVTCCRPDEDRSSVAASLAAALGRTSQGRVLLLDARGLGEVEQNGHLVLPGYEMGKEGVVPSQFPRPCVGESAVGLMASLKRDYSFVVLDAPSILKSSGAARVCGLADAVLLVLEAERTRWEVAQEVKRLLGEARANVLGVVLNRRRYHVPGWLYERL